MCAQFYKNYSLLR